MPCSPTEQLPFFFKAYDPPYMSGDIDSGIGLTTVPAPETVYTGAVSINNDGAAAGGGGPADPPEASVRLWAVQPGTNPGMFPAPADATVAIAACSGSSSRATAPVTYRSPAFGGSSHYCLIAKVKNGVMGPAFDYTPAWDLNNTGDPAAPYLRIAQRNVFVIAGGGEAGTPQARRMAFAFVIANPTKRELKTQIIANPIDAKDERWVARIKADKPLRTLLDMGPLARPLEAGVAVGQERVFRTSNFRLYTERLAKKLELDPKRVAEAMPRPGELAHVGALSLEHAKQLMVRGPRPEQSVGLQEQENRQGIVVIEAPPNARPGSMFGVDIRHELTERESAEQPRLLGGLVVFLRVPHPDDPKPPKQ